MSKLTSVIRHEYLTIVRQPSFWTMMLIMPIFIAIIIGINIFSSESGSNQIQETAKKLESVVVVDKSGLVSRTVVEASGLTVGDASEEATLLSSVKNGDISGLIVYPRDLVTQKTYQIYLNGMDFTVLSAVQSTGDSILKSSLLLPLGSPDIISLAQTGASGTMTFYENGAQTGGFNDYIAPGLFLVLFFLVLSLSLSFMLASVSEEKENRSMEMVLTYVKPRTLIIGKILGISLITLTQVAFFFSVAALGFFVLQQSGTSTNLPLGISLADITFDPAVIALSLGFLLTGFTMYAGLMVIVAAMVPTSKEANNFSSVFIIGSILPIYFLMLIIADPKSPVTAFLTFFPLTSPMTNLLRNTVGSLDLTTGLLALAVMAIFAVISVGLAIRAFRLGALEFAQNVKLTSLFKK